MVALALEGLICLIMAAPIVVVLTAFGSLIGYVIQARPWLGNHFSSILAVCLAFWSLATAACGIAGSYLQLLLGRIGVAGGESSTNPAIMSTISDLFPPGRRAIAIGFSVWGDVPNPLAMAGIAVIVASGLYILHRERVRAAERRH